MDPEQAARELRSMVLKLSAADIGVTLDSFPQQVWGMVMETGSCAGHYSLVALADGTTSLYFSSGGGVIGAGERPEVRQASHHFIERGNEFLTQAKPCNSTEPPNAGMTQFFFLSFEGIRSYIAQEVSLGEMQDPLSPLFHAGHAVITKIRQETS